MSSWPSSTDDRFPGLARVLDFGPAREKIFGKLHDSLAPADQMFGSERVFDKRAGVFEVGKQRCTGCTDAAGKGEIAGAEFGEDQATEILIRIESKTGVEGQLDVIGAGQVPGPGRNISGFVIDDENGVVAKAVEAVKAQFEVETG